MITMIIIKLLVRQAKLSLGQCDVSIFDRDFEERMNAKVDLHDRKVLQQ